MRVKMKSILLVCLYLSLFLMAGVTPCYAYSDTFTTGEEWEQKMSKGEKFISVYAPMILFHRYGVNFRKSPGEYIETMEKVLVNNPYLEKEDVSNIFASTVYAYEPESRPAFRIMEAEFTHQELSPHLLIKTNPTPEVDQVVED